MKMHAKISLVTPEPVTPEADRETSELIARINVELAPIIKISYTILLCGPQLEPPSPIAVKRQEIFEVLEKLGHKPYYSETLPRDNNVSQRNAQEAAGQAVDLIIVLVDIRVLRTINEAHHLCEISEFNRKMHLLVPIELKEGEDGDETLQQYDAGGFGKLDWYTSMDIPACNVLTWAMGFVKAHQNREYKWRKRAMSGE